MCGGSEDTANCPCPVVRKDENQSDGRTFG